MDSSVIGVERAALWRRALRQPVLWAGLCAASAFPWYLNGNGLDLPPYILVLASGWLCGLAFVNFTVRLKKPRPGVLVHVAGAVALAALLSWAVFGEGNPLASAPKLWREVFALLQLAGIPAVGWIWLGLLGRVTFIARTPAVNAKPARTAPEWEADQSGALLRFPALTLRIQTLTWIIIATIAVAGTIFLFWMVSSDWLLRIGSAQLVILIVGVFFALPSYFVLKTVLDRRTVDCSLIFESEQMRIEVAGISTTVRYDDVDQLIWRCDSHYARLEVHGTGHDFSLIAGFARVPQTSLAQLPPLSQRTKQRLAKFGLREQRTRRPGLARFQRAAPRSLRGHRGQAQ